jgi:hypothetical protein
MTEASAILLLFKLSVLIFRAKGFLTKYYFIKLVVKPKFFIWKFYWIKPTVGRDFLASNIEAYIKSFFVRS